MSVAYFLAHRIRFRKSSDAQRVTPPAVRIAIAGIAVGLVVMILTVAIVVGFKQDLGLLAFAIAGVTAVP